MATSDFIDKIGDRLDHPERVPPELQHLISDDQQRVTRILSFMVQGQILDVGCSDGAITRRIAQRWGVRTQALDIEAGQHAYAHDIRQPLPRLWTREYDAVYACELFEHLTDADAVKARDHMLDVLHPSGSLIVTVPNRDCAEQYVAGCRDRWKWPDHRSVWTYAKLQKFLGDALPIQEWVPLYDGEAPRESIWLIVRARGPTIGASLFSLRGSARGPHGRGHSRRGCDPSRAGRHRDAR